ncbi:uncharacterized protein LOC118785840 [Megalops cyprinoides]|uniref:uncharacterized protein LOC118785840 n=1 Tax=Megalops cyprinoides TaxID=118141 RepID=UPI0018641682|nr:uncharacterized protein LOC118785840 [Megalops cyprinoides]
MCWPGTKSRGRPKPSRHIFSHVQALHPRTLLLLLTPSCWPLPWRSTLPAHPGTPIPPGPPPSHRSPAQSCCHAPGGLRCRKSSTIGWAGHCSGGQPAGARPIYTQPPATAHPFFQRPFCLWLPYRMWAYHFRCPACGGKLVGAGLYKTVRSDGSHKYPQ